MNASQEYYASGDSIALSWTQELGVLSMRRQACAQQRAAPFVLMPVVTSLSLSSFLYIFVGARTTGVLGSQVKF